MKPSVTIIISHYESLPFLRACLRQIEKYRHPDIIHDIIVADQSNAPYRNDVWDLCRHQNISYVNMEPLWSGYSVDKIMRFSEDGKVGSDYICQLHVDAFPINKNWLKLPITLIEENNFAFVGQHHFSSKETDTIYPPGKFFSMSPTFNVAPTSIYEEMSLEAGFTRYHNRLTSGLTFKSKVWDEWAEPKYRERGSDDDTVAFHWEDTHREHNKLALGVSGKVGTGNEPGFGRMIEDLVFHFGSCRESIGVMGAFGRRYEDWTNRIKSEEGFSDELIAELLSQSIPSDPTTSRFFWDGKTKEQLHSSHSINQRVNELKKL